MAGELGFNVSSAGFSGIIPQPRNGKEGVPGGGQVGLSSGDAPLPLATRGAEAADAFPISSETILRNVEDVNVAELALEVAAQTRADTAEINPPAPLGNGESVDEKLTNFLPSEGTGGEEGGRGANVSLLV